MFDPLATVTVTFTHGAHVGERQTLELTDVETHDAGVEGARCVGGGRIFIPWSSIAHVTAQ